MYLRVSTCFKEQSRTIFETIQEATLGHLLKHISEYFQTSLKPMKLVEYSIPHSYSPYEPMIGLDVFFLKPTIEDHRIEIFENFLKIRIFPRFLLFQQHSSAQWLKLAVNASDCVYKFT